MATLRVGALIETSGLAASHVHPDIYYAHNDSGDRARFFAIDDRATLRGEFQLAGATAIDWEDIAVGPCEAASCVFIGDLGDNHGQRTSVAIYRLREPALPSDTRAPVTVHADRFEFTYPDAPHDAEALAVDPHSGAIFVFTKAIRHSRVYRLELPARPGARVEVRFVRQIEIRGGIFPLVTGADIHPCDARLLLRTYSGAIEFRAPPDGLIEDALATRGTPVPAADEYQSEAIAYRADGLGYLTVPEGVNVEMHAVDCAP